MLEDGTQEFPRFMCGLCSDLVDTFMEFRLECIRSLDTLQKLKTGTVDENVEIIEVVGDGDEKYDEDMKLEMEHFSDTIIEVETVEDQDIDMDSYISDTMIMYKDTKLEEDIHSHHIDEIIEIGKTEVEGGDGVEETMIGSADENRNENEAPNSIQRKRNSEKLVLTMDGNLVSDQSDYEPGELDDSKEKAKRKSHPYKHKMDLCHICGDFKAMLYNHVHLVHNERRPYSCLYCPKTFRQISHKNRHHRTHFNDRPYKCDECPKAFYDSASLKKHKQGHAGIRQYVCSICNNAFVYASVLKKHVATHLQNRQFECSECGKKFLTRTEQKQHMMIHTGEKPYNCRLCEKRFRTSGMRRIHEMNVHQVKRPTIKE